MAVFDENTDITEVTVEALVGEGKKFKTPDDLARGKIEADRVITARERELAELREELAKRTTLEELYEKIQNKSITPPVNNNSNVSTEQKPAAVTLSDEDLARRIEELADKRTREQKIQENVELVSERLIQEFGSEEKANEVVKQKAKELGVSVAFLQDVAANSPKALFAQLGLNDGPKATPPVNRSDVKTEILSHNQSAKPGTYGYWQEARKSMKPDEYFSPRVQNQIMKEAFAAAERGEDYFKT